MPPRVLLLIGLVLVSCRPAPHEALSGQGVIHLDPRLADGRSPADVLDTGPALVREWSIGPDFSDAAEAFSDLEPWEWTNAVARAGTATSGLMVRAADYRPADGVTYAYASYPEPVSAERINRIEVDLHRSEPGTAGLTWESVVPGAGLPDGLRYAQAMGGSGSLDTVVFDLSSNPAWAGSITDLRLYPSWRGQQSFEITAIRFSWIDFSPGSQPGREFGLADGDAGLCGLDGDLRRTWPADSSVPLFAACEVPAGGRFVSEVAIAPRPGASDDAYNFALDARRRAGDEWEERARLAILPSGAGSGTTWHGLKADLADLQGGAAELRLRCWTEGDARSGLGGELSKDRFWWGNPMVIPTGDDLSPQSVLLVTLDTLRADVLGFYGGSVETPHLDRLADQSLVFENAWSACNSTLPSHASILTGLSVPAHGVLDNRSTMDPEVGTLAQGFRRAGYHTAAAVSVDHLTAGWSGLGRGFDQYLDVQRGAAGDGANTIDRVTEWSDLWVDQGERPTFLWLHLFDPHTPYDPPRAYLKEYVDRLWAAGGSVPPSRVEAGDIGRTGYTAKGQFLDGVNNHAFARFLYEASVSYTDKLVGDLVDCWVHAGRWDQTVLALTADHGESLGERGVYYGHQLLHEPVMRVPLILRVPGGAAERVTELAWSPDVAATLGGMFDLGCVNPSGMSLLDLQSRGDGRRVWFVHAGMDQVGCRDGDVHYWHNLKEYLQLGPERRQAMGEDYLYDPSVDPGLLNNLADVKPALAAKYSNAMKAWLEQRDVGRRLQAELQDSDEELLRQLGYGGGDQ